jgi:putative membrane protein
MEDPVTHRIIAVSLALLTAGPAFAQSAKTTGDAGVIDRVARDGRAEVELGQLASQKAATPEVKAFAQRLVTDHTKANERLMSIAQSERVSPPTGVDQEHIALRSKLEGLSGSSFDRAFVQAQIDGHKKDIQYLQKEANAVKDAKLKTFIQQTLPVMQQHLQMAHQIETQLSSSGSSVAPKHCHLVAIIES